MKKNNSIYIIIALISVVILALMLLLNKKEKTEPYKPIKELENVKFNTDKINIYLFWSEECKHCKAIRKFLSNMDEDYKKLYNLYEIEISKSEENRIMLNDFGRISHTDTTGVPVMFIGKETVKGFVESMGQEIKDKIKKAYDSKDKTDYYQEYLKRNK